MQMPEKSLKAIHVGSLGSLAQFHLGSNLEKDYFDCLLQSLYYNLDDIHNLTPNIQEVMAFRNWLSVK
jgi:hypothetical protein